MLFQQCSLGGAHRVSSELLALLTRRTFDATHASTSALDIAQFEAFGTIITTHSRRWQCEQSIKHDIYILDIDALSRVATCCVSLLNNSDNARDKSATANASIASDCTLLDAMANSIDLISQSAVVEHAAQRVGHAHDVDESLLVPLVDRRRARVIE